MIDFPGYRAERQTDGTLVIFDVPIFVRCKRGDTDYDDAWLQAAFQRAQQAARDGYLPPLHVRHHTPDSLQGDRAQAAGFFRIQRMGPLEFKGETRTALFADLCLTVPWIEQDVLAKRLPWRSVEILDVTKPSIDSLALLDHEAPYLELPMLMVAEVSGDPGSAGAGTPVANATFRTSQVARQRDRRDSVVACFRRGKAAIFITADEPMSDTNKSGEEKKGDKQAESAAVDVSAIVKAIEAGSIAVADLDSILAAVAKLRQGSGEAAPAPTPGDQMAKSREGEGDAAKAAAESAQFAKLAGENAALKARLDELDASQKRSQDVAVALRKLADRPLGSDLEAKLQAFHKQHGAAAFSAYVNSMAETFAALPRDTAADRFAGQSAGKTQAPPSVTEPYVPAGTDAVAKAAQFAAEWSELSSRGLARMSQERYVEVNMDRIGIAKAKAKAS